MIIESDLLYAYVKKHDWLKPTAEKIINAIVEGKLGTVHASRMVLHELYYVSKNLGVDLDEFISKAASLTAIPNLSYHPTTVEIDLLALVLMKQYRVSSIFDAYHAATALNQEQDHTIISTDHIYDAIPGITRIDPRELEV